MSLPIREQALAALAARLAIIRTTAGYHFNLGLYVSRVQRFHAETGSPTVSVWDGRETAAAQHRGILLTLPVSVQASVPYTAASDAAYLIADIYKCLATWAITHETVPGFRDTVIERLEYAGAEPLYPESGSSVLSVRSDWNLSIAVRRGDPYTSIQP